MDELIQKASANYLLTITNPIITTYRSSCVVSSYNNDPGIGVGIKSLSFNFVMFVITADGPLMRLFLLKRFFLSEPNVNDSL